VTAAAGIAAEEKPVLAIAFVGHVDHGKSTMIGRIRHELSAVAGATDAALAGNWAHAMDQLQEERDREMTIDTTQTFLELPELRLVFIDVPGHQHLIHNMLTGATRADAAVLVLAADEGVQDQTRRHALLLSLLGIREVVVAINKMDKLGLGEAAFAALATLAKAQLGELGIHAKAIVPTVAQAGDNVVARSAAMPWYAGPSLMEAVGEVEPAAASFAATRFPVQDVYRFDGETIVAGRLLSGGIAEGDSLVAHPGGAAIEVREVRRFPASRAPAVAGESIGLIVAGATPARGVVLASADDAPTVTDRPSGRVFWLAEAPLALGDTLTLRCATQAAPVRVASIEARIDTATLAALPPAEHLERMELGTVHLHAERPLVFESFAALPGLGRFVLERGGVPVGAGIVP